MHKSAMWSRSFIWRLLVIFGVEKGGDSLVVISKVDYSPCKAQDDLLMAHAAVVILAIAEVLELAVPSYAVCVQDILDVVF